MLEDLPEKFGKLKMPEGSLIKKLERIKKGADGAGPYPLIPDVIDQLRKASKEISGKVEDANKKKSELIKSNTDAIQVIETKITNLEQIISSGKSEKDEFKERLAKMDETILELLSLYEVVSSTMNPFVGDNDNSSNQKIIDLEKKVDELLKRSPQIPTDFLNEFENKMKGFENNIEELKKKVDVKDIEEKALADKITELVNERVKVNTTIPPEIEETNKLQNPQQVQASVIKKETILSQNIDEVKNNVSNVSNASNVSNVKLSYFDNRPETSIVLLNWIEFLLEKVGRNNLFDVLEYYIDIGWISEEISSKMMVYASGIDYYVERPTWKLLPEDHTKSLLFIEQIRGNKIDKNHFSRLERDVGKIIRNDELIKL